MKVIRVFDVFIMKRRKRGRFGEKEKEGLKNEGMYFSFSLSEIVSEKWG